MIEKTTGIVLRVQPHSATSHIVTWLTPDHGKLYTLVKGACRPKSPFLGQYDLFYTCELLYYARTHGLNIARECSIVDPRPAFRTDWRASVCASYICDLVSRISPGQGHQHELYECASVALDFIAGNGARPQYLLWFELALAASLGFPPRLSACANCSAGISNGPAFFSFHDGGMLCGDCTSRSDKGGITIQPDVAAMLRNWQCSDSPRAAWNTRCTPGQLANAQLLSGRFLDYHLELDGRLDSRQIAYSMIGSAGKV